VTTHAPMLDGALEPGQVDLSAIVPLTDQLTAAYLEYYALLPVRIDGDRLLVATWIEDHDPQVLDDLRLLFNREIVFVSCAEEDVRGTIQRVYGAEADTAAKLIAGLPIETVQNGEHDLALDDLVSQANEAPVVKLVNLLLLEALDARASDVHLEGYHSGLRVRYRIDGVLQDAPSPPVQLTAAVVSRLKIMADLDIAERRVPQDGRIRLRLQDRQVDVRVSTLPTLHGESIVLRLLDKAKGWNALEELGMGQDTLSQFSSAISRPYGIVLATGPTGSGKTTTLYAAVDRIRTGREKILTVEDPVEFELPGGPQVPVNEEVGVTFATALRALLRQDPDMMLVGEIRDDETAEIATHAALTGHLVLSTLHTNDSASALTRLLDLGVAPYLVTSTIEAVLAQRLVRKVCPQCAEPVEPSAEALRGLGLEVADLAEVLAGSGCEHCRGTGFFGRTGIYELLVLDEELRAAVLQEHGAATLRSLAVGKGMRTLRDDGIRQLRAGVTTPEEVLRVSHGE